MAVAQVIAYVFSLKEAGAKPGRPTKLKPKVPNELKFDERGQRPLADT
jgi:hypothetical protein